MINRVLFLHFISWSIGQALSTTFWGSGSGSASKWKVQNIHIFKEQESSAPITIFHVEISGEVEKVADRVTEETERAQQNTRDSPFKGIVSRYE